MALSDLEGRRDDLVALCNWLGFVLRSLCPAKENPPKPDLGLTLRLAPFAMELHSELDAGLPEAGLQVWG